MRTDDEFSTRSRTTRLTMSLSSRVTLSEFLDAAPIYTPLNTSVPTGSPISHTTTERATIHPLEAARLAWNSQVPPSPRPLPSDTTRPSTPRCPRTTTPVWPRSSLETRPPTSSCSGPKARLGVTLSSTCPGKTPRPCTTVSTMSVPETRTRKSSPRLWSRTRRTSSLDPLPGVPLRAGC
jgi:hypothetical protein